jgi:hypothetical protein
VALNAKVVTNNVKDFAKYPGVVLENWLEPLQGSSAAMPGQNH